MKVEQRQWTQAQGWQPAAPGPDAEAAQVVFVFGATAVLQQHALSEQLRRDYPDAWLFGCSTAGEIAGTQVSDDSLVATAVQFERTPLRHAMVDLAQTTSSHEAGEALGRQLPPTVQSHGAVLALAHVLVLSDGLNVNGSDLVSGLGAALPCGVSITGGMAGDGPRFGQTLVYREGTPCEQTVAVLGLYGPHLKVGFGSLGGWDSFGPERLITKSCGNVLYELDGHSALRLYKQYLGDHAHELPASGLLFPLSLRTNPGEPPVVRTILSVDEQAQSLTFAGDVPEGAYARLMKANFDRLIDGAMGAARTSRPPLGAAHADLALLISCVGRKLVLKQRIEEEVEAVREVLGHQPALAGFYSYGEISPFSPGARCELHNQTMTITTLAE
ncbi:MAG: FIST signal transduction protein [Ramlibacter sp.]